MDFTPEVVDGFGFARTIGVDVDYRGGNRWQIIGQAIGGGSKLHITAAKQGFGIAEVPTLRGQRVRKTVFDWFPESIYCGSKKESMWGYSAQHGAVELSDVLETEWVSAHHGEIRMALREATIAAVEKYGDQVCSKCVKQARL
jgi:hypothetical protein